MLVKRTPIQSAECSKINISKYLEQTSELFPNQYNITENLQSVNNIMTPKLQNLKQKAGRNKFKDTSDISNKNSIEMNLLMLKKYSDPSFQISEQLQENRVLNQLTQMTQNTLTQNTFNSHQFSENNHIKSNNLTNGKKNFREYLGQKNKIKQRKSLQNINTVNDKFSQKKSLNKLSNSSIPSPSSVKPLLSSELYHKFKKQSYSKIVQKPNQKQQERKITQKKNSINNFGCQSENQLNEVEANINPTKQIKVMNVTPTPQYNNDKHFQQLFQDEQTPNSPNQPQNNKQNKFSLQFLPKSIPEQMHNFMRSKNDKIIQNVNNMFEILSLLKGQSK